MVLSLLGLLSHRDDADKPVLVASSLVRHYDMDGDDETAAVQGDEFEEVSMAHSTPGADWSFGRSVQRIRLRPCQ